MFGGSLVSPSHSSHILLMMMMMKKMKHSKHSSKYQTANASDSGWWVQLFTCWWHPGKVTCKAPKSGLFKGNCPQTVASGTPLALVRFTWIAASKWHPSGGLWEILWEKHLQIELGMGRCFFLIKNRSRRVWYQTWPSFCLQGVPYL